MWPFSRKQPAPPPDGGPVLPQVRFDWKQLPAIQRTVADHPLTVQTASFASGLTTHADPRAIAEPLGHRVTLEAPPGLILDFVRPQTRNEGPELVGRSRASHQRPVQRMRTESAMPDVDEGQVSPVFDDAMPRAEQPIRHLPASAEPRPSLSLMRVSSETAPTPLPSRFEAPPPPEAPVAPAEPESAAVGSAAEGPALPRLTLGQARRLGLGAPIPRVPDSASSVQRSRESDTIAPAFAPEAAPTVEPAPIGEAAQFQPFVLDYLITKKAPPPAPTPISRRQRIAPPISVSRSAADEAPANMPAASEADRAEESVEYAGTASAAPEPIQREPAAAGEEIVPAVQRTVDSQEDASEAATIKSDLPDIGGHAEAPLQRSATAELAGATPKVDTPVSTTLLSAPATGETGETGETAEGRAAELPALPLAAGRAFPSVQRQAATSDEPASSAGETAPLVSAGPAIGTLVPPTLTLPTPAGEAKITEDSEPGSGMPSRPIAAPSSAPAGVASLAMAATPTVARAIDPGPMPVLQRAAAASTPTRPIVPAFALPLASRSGGGWTTLEPQGPSAPARPPMVETPLATLTLPPPPVGGKSDPELPLPLGPVARVSDAAPAIQRIASTQPDQSQPSSFVGGTASGSAEPPYFSSLPAVVQRSAHQEWSVQTEPAETAAAESPAGAHAAGPGSADHTDLDALANKLYDRIRVKLRHELLIDRERAGLLTDLR